MSLGICRVCYSSKRTSRHEILVSNRRKTNWFTVQACNECWSLFRCMLDAADMPVEETQPYRFVQLEVVVAR